MSTQWDLTPREARIKQEKLRDKIKIKKLKKPITVIAGADVSLNLYKPWLYAGIAIFSYPNLELIEAKFSKCQIGFPYIPGLLSFREIPCLLDVWVKLAHKPDLVFVDGHGIAHPRRLGIATHFGLVTNTPTVGVAKKLLYGNHEDVSLKKDNWARVLDPRTQEVIGYVVRTKSNVKPVFVSAGHLITNEEARDIALSLTKGYRIPEPTRLAHNMVNEYRRLNS